MLVSFISSPVSSSSSSSTISAGALLARSLWARRNLAVARSHEVSPEERRHAQRALSIMMNVQWKSNYFEAIDPQEARRILDEELYGMESVKQRIIETIIQINRTHTLPAYGLLAQRRILSGRVLPAQVIKSVML